MSEQTTKQKQKRERERWADKFERAAPLAGELASEKCGLVVMSGNEYEHKTRAYNGMTAAAHSWQCCAVGEQLDLPRLRRMCLAGSPYLNLALKYHDPTLHELGLDFSNQIDEYELDKARRTYAKIGERIRALGGSKKVLAELKEMLVATDELPWNADTLEYSDKLREARKRQRSDNDDNNDGSGE